MPGISGEAIIGAVKVKIDGHLEHGIRRTYGVEWLYRLVDLVIGDCEG